MQILIHISVLQRILGRLVGACNTSIEMLQVLCEANSHLEWIHDFWLLMAVASIGNLGRDEGLSKADAGYLFILGIFERARTVEAKGG